MVAAAVAAAAVAAAAAAAGNMGNLVCDNLAYEYNRAWISGKHLVALNFISYGTYLIAHRCAVVGVPVHTTSTPSVFLSIQ